MTKKVLIGIPTRGGDLYYGMVKFLLFQVARIPRGIDVIFAKSTISAEAAQTCLFTYMAEGAYDYFMYVDSDVAPPNDTLVKLMLADKDIISAPVWFYESKSGDIHLGVQVGLDTRERIYNTSGKKGLEKVCFPGLACTLIKKRVFDGFVKAKESPLQYSKLIPEEYKRHNTDNILYEKARALGFETWVDWDIGGVIHRRPVDLSTLILEKFIGQHGRG